MSRVGVAWFRRSKACVPGTLLCLGMGAADAQTGQGPEKLLKAAEQLFQAEKHAEAAAAFEQVIGLAPGCDDCYFALGICYGRTGDRAKAESNLRKYLSLHPSSAPAREALARLRFESRDWEGARDLLDPLLSSSPLPDESVLALLGHTLFAMNRTERALQVCERGLRHYPESAKLEELHAALLVDCGRREACRKRALECLASKPRSSHYQKAVTEMLLDQDSRSEAAARMVKRTVEANPGDPGARYLHARWLYDSNLLQREAQYRAAITEARRVLAMPATGAAIRMQSLCLIGLAHDRLGDSQEAEQALRQAFELNRSLRVPNPSMGMSLVNFLARADRAQETAGLVAEILRWSPEFAPARLERAKLLARAGRPEEAIDEARAALPHAGGNEDLEQAIHVFLARTCFQLGREGEAQIHQDWVERRQRKDRR